MVYCSKFVRYNLILEGKNCWYNLFLLWF